jgi:hypothetical protein
MDARECVEKIRAAGYHDLRVERVLELPRRTLSRAFEKNQVDEEAMLALLRSLATFPFLILVAESGFNEKVAKELRSLAASELLLDRMQYI